MTELKVNLNGHWCACSISLIINTPLICGHCCPGNLAWWVRQVTELEVNMNAVERMVEWKDSKEEADGVREPRPHTGWPHAGNIQVGSLV
jgi:hypothetical protein